MSCHLTLSRQSGLLPQIRNPHSEPLHNLGKHFRQGICIKDPEVHFLSGKHLLNRYEPALFNDQHSEDRRASFCSQTPSSSELMDLTDGTTDPCTAVGVSSHTTKHA